MSLKQGRSKRVLVIPDKFKGSLSAQEVCSSVMDTWKEYRPLDIVRTQPMADGGEGSVDILSEKKSFQIEIITVSDPLHRPISSSYHVSDGVAFIEMSKAAGFLLLADAERNCMNTSSYGVGQMIRHAVENEEVDTINLFIGGSATNDIGIGMATALGYRFIGAEGKEILPVGSNLAEIISINEHHKNSRLCDVIFNVICDVNNPLVGQTGAAHTYATQKGASDSDIEILEEGAVSLANIIHRDIGVDATTIQGGGAAGGMGAGAVAFLGANMISGVEFMIDHLDIEEMIKQTDVVITGEGKLDNQSLHGKVIDGIAALCVMHNKPLHIICGLSTLSKDSLISDNITVHDILSIAQSHQDAMENARLYLRDIIGNIINDI